MSDDEVFLKRWSRKKRQDVGDSTGRGKATEPLERATAATVTSQTGTKSGTQATEGKNCEPLDLASLPKLEELTQNSDIRAFLDPRVPAPLRDAVLKRAWTIDPAIRDFIEVAENQWDWNRPGGAPGYGPLDDAKIVAQLLDHAVGVIMGKGQDDKPILSSDVHSLSLSDCPDVALHKHQPASFDIAESTDSLVTRASEPANDKEAMPHKADDRTSVAGAYRRRHGRALPD